MKIFTISSGIAALLLCLAHTAQSFVVSPQVKPIGSTTSLKLLSDQQVWEQTALADKGFAVRPGRSGMDYYPRYSPAAGSLTYNGGYNYGYYNNDYYGYGGGLGRTLGYNDYYYNGYDNGYYGGYGGGTSTVQGHTRRTWSTSHSDSSNVQLESDGRPMHANVEVWQGAGGHSPAKMRLYSEDGYMRPWNAGFANTPRGGYTSSVTVQNEAPVAFPMRATVGNTNYNSRNYGMGGYGMGGGAGQYIGSSRRSQVTIDGSGALRTFSFGPNTHSVVVEIWSDGMPFWADVEMWQGPNSVKQTAEVYSDSGSDRPWSAVIPTPGMSGTICIRNVGPMEFPFKVCVEPMMY